MDRQPKLVHGISIDSTTKHNASNRYNVAEKTALTWQLTQTSEQRDREILAELKASLARLPPDQRKRVAHHLLLRLPALRKRLATRVLNKAKEESATSSSEMPKP